MAQARPSEGLRIFVVDVEGGGATLVIAPSNGRNNFSKTYQAR